MTELSPTRAIDEITRRQWLLILGRIAALTGFSGVAPTLSAALPDAKAQRSKVLPPGLYYPSQEHLSHALGELGSVHAIPPGSETEYLQPNSGSFHPLFFSDQELKVVTRLADILLGKVDAGALSQSVSWLDLYLFSAPAVREAALKLDPLHRALAVGYYGESAVQELETADPQRVMRSGLAALQKLSIEQYGRDFLAIDELEQTKVVSTISSAKPQSEVCRLFELTRTEAARGYYTSADGLKELDYKNNWYYAACPGCDQKT